MSLTGLVGGYGSDDSGSASSGDNKDHGGDIGSRGGVAAGSASAPASAAGAPATGGVKGSPKTPKHPDTSRKCESDGSSGSGSSNDDSSSSEAEGEGAEGSRENKRKSPSNGAGENTLLPSVEDLFSSTAGPDFLSAPGAGKEFVVEATKKENKRKDKLSISASFTGPTGTAAAVASKRERDVAAGAGGGTASAGVKKLKGGTAGPVGPPVERRKKGVGGSKDGKEKISAKDKVKGQRLKGQSGIGSDFRTWKSDLEMTMRQHYD